MPRTSTPFALALLLVVVAPPAGGQDHLDSARDFIFPDPGEFHAIADVDGNGADDLVRFRGTPGTPTHFEGFQVMFNDGTGDLPGAGPFVAFNLISNRFRPLSEDGPYRTYDVTGDSRPDVFVVEEIDYQTDFALHLHPSIGTGTFGPPVSAPLTGAMRGAAFGQIDGDPAMELATLEVAGFSWIVTWYDVVGGVLVPSVPVTVPFPGPFGFKQPARPVAIDVDHDGDDDVVVGEASGAVLHVFPTVGGAPSAESVVPVPGTTFHRVDPYVVDLVGGGAEDLVLIVRANSSDAADVVPVLTGAGGLTFGAAHTLTPGTGETFGGRFAFGDWDGDGDPDLLSYPWQVGGGGTEAIVAFFENDGADVFSGPVARAETVRVGAAPIGTSDLDGDGDLDVVLPQGAFYGQGAFESSLEPVTTFYYSPSPIAALDHDGDGDVDLVLDDGSVRLNDATGRYPEVVFLPPAPAGVIEREVVSAGDFSGDGRPDLLVAHFVPGQPLPLPVFQEMRLYAGDALGTFVDAASAAATNMAPYSRVANVVFDLDADGDLDVLDATPGGYYPNAGNGTFLPLVNLFGSGHEPSAVADVDQDGDPDVAVVDNWSSLTLWTNQGGLSFTSAVVHAGFPSLESDSVTFADQDGDGDVDLAFSQAYGETTFLYVNDGAGGFTAGPVLDTGLTTGNDPPMTSLSFDDVDGDGTIDLLAGATGTHSDTPRDVLLYRGLG
ncbi:MAG: FG-GAP repeat domain-containing protein, partial [Planctomycetota bacterium JB042]